MRLGPGRGVVQNPLAGLRQLIGGDGRIDDLVGLQGNADSPKSRGQRRQRGID